MNKKNKKGNLDGEKKKQRKVKYINNKYNKNNK
jgi:hypothetical protein